MKEWDSVTIVTAAWKESSINPTYTMLEILAETGIFGQNVHFHKVRGIYSPLHPEVGYK